MSEIFERDRFDRDHRWAPGQMSAYLDGELTDATLARMERHLGECAECRRLLASLTRLIKRLTTLAAPSGGPDPSEIAAAVRARLDQPPPRD
jgi:anti-sigma factor RsiW